jgi:hypothetical protein
MIICNNEQGSEAWLRDRLGIPTASEFGKVLANGRGGKPSATKESYKALLLAERLSHRPANTFTSAAMERGTELEPEARSTYEVISGNQVEQIGFVKLDSGIAGASPDGWIGDDGGLEIKCPETHNHVATVLAGEMPAKHKPQVQGNLWICEREWWDFVSYDDRVDASGIVIYRQYRDEDYIKTMAEEIEKFCEELEQLEQKLREG